MAKLTADSFLTVLQQSDLLERDRIKTLMGEMQSAGVNVQDSAAIGSWMVENGHLTSWQVEKLQRGKHKGFRLGKYRLRELLGKGGMSSVYLAEHTLMRRRCAIKVLPIKKVNDSSYLARFFREAQAVASLDHPNIVRAYDIDKEVEKNQEIHFLVMEYVKGRSLHEIVKEDGALSFEDAAEFGRQAALGLDHAHQSGLVHRDVKPGNLLQDHSGTVKVLDLGLARFAEVAGSDDDEAPLTVAHDEKVLGTADYLSPEQALDSHLVDNRADIYSLGCSLYFALTAQPSFKEGTIAQRLMWHQMKEPPPMTEARADVPESLSVIIRRMMAKKPEDRFQSMGDVAAELLKWLSKNAGSEWKSRHSEVLSGAVDAPTAVPVAPVAAPVQPASPPAAPVAAPIEAPPAAPVITPTAAPVEAAPIAPPPIKAAPIEAPPPVEARPIETPPPVEAPPIAAAPAPVAESPTADSTDAVFPGLPTGFDDSPVAEPAASVESAAPAAAVPDLSGEPTLIETSPGVAAAEAAVAAAEEEAAQETALPSGQATEIVAEPMTDILGGKSVTERAPEDTAMDMPEVNLDAAAVPADEAPPATTTPVAVASPPAPATSEPAASDDSVFPGLPGATDLDGSTLSEPATPAATAPEEPHTPAPAEPIPAPAIDVTQPAPAAPAEPVAPTPPPAARVTAEPSFPDFSSAPTAAAPVQAGSNVGFPTFDRTAPDQPAGVAAGFDPGAATPPREAIAKPKKSGPPPGMIVGIVVLIVALAGGGFYLFGGGDDSEGSDGQTQGGGEGETGEGTSGGGGTGAGGAAKFLGYQLTVGTEGNFKTLSALLKNLRANKSKYRDSRNSRIFVTVSPGKYSESLVIDNTDHKTYPNGIKLKVEGDSPAVLTPSGNGPVVKLTDVENFLLEGFQIDASARDVGVELNGDLDRSVLKNVTITGYSKSGIRSNGASGRLDEEFVIEDVRFQPSGGNSVGIVFAESNASRIHMKGCRFLGPQNSAIVFEEGASEVIVRDSIISQAGIGITFAGNESVVRNVVIFNSTFYDCSKAGLHFSSVPASGSFGLAVHRNIFSKLGGAEAIVASGYELKAFQSFLASGGGGIQYNWSDRQAAADQKTEWEVILRPEQRVSQISFASTDSSSPDFLKPTTPFNGFRPGGGSQRYPGAVKPK